MNFCFLTNLSLHDQNFTIVHRICRKQRDKLKSRKRENIIVIFEVLGIYARKLEGVLVFAKC